MGERTTAAPAVILSEARDARPARPVGSGPLATLRPFCGLRRLAMTAGGARSLLFSLSLLLSACASGPTRYLHPNADLGAIRKVAVLPFENVSGTAGASDKVHKIFLVEVLSMEAFEVVEPGMVAKALKGESAASPDQLTPDDLKRIGKALGADGLFLGQVVDYADTRGTTSAPEVTLQFRLVETASGATVWSTSDTRSGVKAATRLFGVSGDSLSETTRRVIRRQLATLTE